MRNYSKTQRIEALRDFYSGPGRKYEDAARDFYKQVD